MTGNHYVIKYSSMDQLYSVISNRIMGWCEDLNYWAEKYGKIVGMETFQGQSADSVKAYLQEVHGVLLYSIQQALTSYQATFLLYKTGYYDLESDKYASIPEEIIEGIRGRLKTESEQLEAIAASIQWSLSSVSDIFPLPIPTKNTLHDTIDGVKEELQKYTSEIGNYETNQYLVANGNLGELLDALQQTIQGYLANDSNIASYKTGAIAGNTNILSLYDKVQQSSEYVAGNQQAIEAAASKQADVYAEMQADYEAACEARKDKGTAQLIMSGVTIFVGAVAIIGTAGMATPIVVTAGVAGSCTIAYGVSNAAEGAQELYYGCIGDVSTAAINPIRDTVFMGNQGVYDAWGSLSMTVAGLCVPVGQAVNGVAGAGTNVMIKTAAKTIAKESIKDTIYDTASGAVTDYATEKFGLNETESTILNLGLSAGIEKGVEFAGDKLGITSKPSLAEKMPLDEAKRYNEYWDNLEKGVHNNHPGLSEADIAAWDLADSKLNEHILVESVDTNALLDLRAKELTLQNSFQNGTVDVLSGDKVYADNPFDEGGNLRSNIRYQTGEFNYNYETDANGRISNWNTDNLQLTERASRLEHNPNTPGKLDGDHAGHLVGDRFGGSPKLDNLVSQSQNVNLSKYKKIENQWAKAITDGKEVTVNVDIKYDGDGLRPTEFIVEYTIDGDFFSQSIIN